MDMTMTMGMSLGGGGWMLLPPTGVTATVDGSDIDLTWTAASSVDGYNVYQQIDGGAWAKLNGATIEALEYTLTPSVPGEYNFRVTSVKGVNESDPSAETTTTEDMMVQVYSDTITGLRISAVAGTAFVDAAAAITGYADGNHLVEIVDSAGKIASGVLKAQGVGETLGAEICTDTGFDSAGAWTILGTASVSGGTGNLPTHGDRIYQSSIAIDKLLKWSIGTRSGNLSLYIDGQTSLSGTAGYRTARANSYIPGFVGLTDGGGIVDDVTVKQVTAPSTSGARLVNALFGTTYNFFSIETGFAHNQASYTVRVKQILPTE